MTIVDEWANKIHRYISIPGALAQRESDIKQSFDPPTWRDCATRVVDVASCFAHE